MTIKQVIIPAAGFGTRFLPLTKTIPKEMLPLIEKPAIQRIVEECSTAGIHDLHVIISREKEAIARHFSPDPLLEDFLRSKNKLALLNELQELIRTNNFHYIYQDQALGLGHAVNLAREKISGDYVAVMLPDDIIVHTTPAIAQLAAISAQYDATVLAIKEVPRESISAYGVIAIEKKLNDDTFLVQDVVEKPSADKAPSCYAVLGRYILSTAIFKALDTITPGAGGELQLTDAIKMLIQNGNRVVAHCIKGDRYDIGNPHGWLEAVNAFAKE